MVETGFHRVKQRNEEKSQDVCEVLCSVSALAVLCCQESLSHSINSKLLSDVGTPAFSLSSLYSRYFPLSLSLLEVSLSPISLSLSLSSLFSHSLSLSLSLTLYLTHSLTLSLTLSGNAGIPLRLWIYSACLSRPQCLSFCKDSGLLETGKVMFSWLELAGKMLQRETWSRVFSHSQSRSVTAGLVLFVLIWNINRIM